MREKFSSRREILREEPKIETQEEKEKREIEMIEKSPLFYQEKKDLVLSYLNEKPASWIDVSERYKQTEKNEDEILNQLELKRDEIRKILDKTGFVYEVEKFKIKERTMYNAGYNFIIARNSEDLSRLKRGLKRGDTKEIGLSIGYPETAVEAFINKKVLDYNKLPKEESKRLIKEKTSKFLDFRLSKNNWQEELNLVRRQQKLIEKKFPNFYKQITKYGLDKIIEKRLDLIEKLQKPSDKLKNLLNLIDESVFPENPLPVKIVKEIKSKYEERIPSAQHYFDEDNEKGKMLNEHYQVNEKINEEHYKLDDLAEISIHEVRHRVQHTLSIELFTRDNFKKFEEKYPSLKLLKEKLPEELSPNDFDACVVENLSSFLRKNSVSLSEISENIIDKNAEDVFKNIEILSKEKGFAIPKIEK